MAIEVFNRYEHKYMLSRKTFLNVQNVLSRYMEPDPYNTNSTPYTIANIYYDTADSFLIRTSLSDPCYKEKLRLRAYGVPEKDDTVYLEIKKKVNGLVNKRRTAIGLNEAYSFLQTGTPPLYKPYMNRQVMREIEYFLKIHPVRPQVYIAYDRLAYFEKDNPDLRISFDLNIRSRRSDLYLEASDYGQSLSDEFFYLMEVKTSLAKPLWLSQMLTELDIKRKKFSKYGTEYKNMLRQSKKTLLYKDGIKNEQFI